MAIATISLRGHLTALVLETALASVEATATGLLVDATDMTDYDAGAREAFVAWNERMRSRIARVAVITQKPLWRMVISAMGVASRQKMKAFDRTVAAKSRRAITQAALSRRIMRLSPAPLPRPQQRQQSRRMRREGPAVRLRGFRSLPRRR